MALIVFGSLSGAPGVTTTVLATALAWPGEQRPVVLEADASGGDLAARFGMPHTPGLIELAAEVRHGADPTAVNRHTLRLETGSGPVPAVLAPPGPVQARAGVAAIAAADPNMWRGEQVVLADAGRLEPGGPGFALMNRADAVVVLIAGETAAVSRAAATLAALRQAAGERLHLAVTAGQYTAAEVAAALDTDITAHLPADEKAAAVLTGRMLAGKRFGRLPLPSKAAALGHLLAHDLDAAVLSGASR